MTEFYEVQGVACAVGHILLWSTYTPLQQEYAAFVAWPDDAA
jgi:hypothetical protein